MDDLDVQNETDAKLMAKQLLMVTSILIVTDSEDAYECRYFSLLIWRSVGDLVVHGETDTKLMAMAKQQSLSW